MNSPLQPSTHKFMITVLCFFLSAVTPCTAATIHVSADRGSEGGNGSEQKPYRRIQQAAEKARPGDVVLVRPGIYRERVKPPRGGAKGSPIVYRSAETGKAVIKGSDVWKPSWKKEASKVYSASPEGSLFTDNAYLEGGNPFKIAMKGDGDKVTLGQVFVDGLHLDEKKDRAAVRTAPLSWCSDNGAIVIHFPDDTPDAHLVEITTRRGVFRPYKRGLGYITVEGFVMEHCGNQFPASFWSQDRNAQSGLIGTRAGHHWIIRDNTIRYAKSIGLTIGNSSGRDTETPKQSAPEKNAVGFILIEGNRFERNGAGGIMGHSHTGCTIRQNVFRENNFLHFTSPEKGGIKVHQAYDLVVEENLFLRENAMGVWFDNTFVTCRISRNLFYKCFQSSIMLEMNDEKGDKRCLVDNNVIIDTRYGRPYQGNAGNTSCCGIYGHDNSGAVIVHNLIAGSTQYGIYNRELTNRKGACANLVIKNNLLVNNKANFCLSWNAPGCDLDRNVFAPEGGRFDINTFGSDKEESMSAIEAAWKAGGSPDGTPGCWIDCSWKRGVSATFKQWQAIKKWDMNSIVATVNGEIVFDEKELTLTIDIGDAAARAGCKKQGGVDRDYLGKPIAADPLAGPFQNLKPGMNTIHLWNGSLRPDPVRIYQRAEAVRFRPSGGSFQSTPCLRPAVNTFTPGTPGAPFFTIDGRLVRRTSARSPASYPMLRIESTER